MRATILAAGAAVSLLTQPALADARRDFDICSQHGFPNVRLDACTRVIGNMMAKPEVRSMALTVRGYIREESGHFKEAMDDYGEAIHLNPRGAYGYAYRSTLHV